LDPFASYLIPFFYLSTLAIFLRQRRILWIIHFSIGMLAVLSNIFINGSGAALRTTLLAGVVFILLILSGILSKEGTIILPIALLSLPVMGWVAVIPGFLVAGLVSLWRVKRATNKDYITSVAFDVLSATGISSALSGQIVKPNFGLLPIPNEQSMKSEGSVGKAHRLKINLNAYLAVSVGLVGILAIWFR
jgi:hypothetical protein